LLLLLLLLLLPLLGDRPGGGPEVRLLEGRKGERVGKHGAVSNAPLLLVAKHIRAPSMHQPKKEKRKEKKKRKEERIMTTAVVAELKRKRAQATNENSAKWDPTRQSYQK
jgi:hypothetical protein